MDIQVYNADGSPKGESERGVVAWQAGLSQQSVGALLTSSPVVPMGDVEYDTANAYDRTNRRYVAKYAGLYRVSWIVSQGAWLNDNDSWLAELWKNGIRYKGGTQDQDDIVSGESSNQNYRKASHGSCQVWLNVGEYLDIRIYSTYGSDSGRSYRAPLTTYTFWEGELIGAAPLSDDGRGLFSQAARVINTVYQPNVQRPVMVNYEFAKVVADGLTGVEALIGASTNPTTHLHHNQLTGTNEWGTGTFIVPAGWYYKIARTNGTANLGTVSEWTL